jgi:hypothetical protein
MAFRKRGYTSSSSSPLFSTTSDFLKKVFSISLYLFSSCNIKDEEGEEIQKVLKKWNINDDNYFNKIYKCLYCKLNYSYSNLITTGSFHKSCKQHFGTLINDDKWSCCGNNARNIGCINAVHSLYTMMRREKQIASQRKNYFLDNSSSTNQESFPYLSCIKNQFQLTRSSGRSPDDVVALRPSWQSHDARASLGSLPLLPPFNNYSQKNISTINLYLLHVPMINWIRIMRQEYKSNESFSKNIIKIMEPIYDILYFNSKKQYDNYKKILLENNNSNYSENEKHTVTMNNGSSYEFVRSSETFDQITIFVNKNDIDSDEEEEEEEEKEAQNTKKKEEEEEEEEGEKNIMKDEINNDNDKELFLHLKYSIIRYNTVDNLSNLINY